MESYEEYERAVEKLAQQYRDTITMQAELLASQKDQIKQLEARIVIERNDNEMYARQLRELRQKLEPPKEYAWECNECGSQEYTMSVSEDDVQQLGCGNCGGDEWHKAEVKP